MNFTEAIRKSNLAKQEVLKTRTTAENIKAALVEQGVDIADVTFDDIAQFIKENSIGVSGPWERPKEWLALPKVVAEESKYTDKVSSSKPSRPPQGGAPQSLDNNKVTIQSVSYFESYLQYMTNLSEVTTGMKDGVFNVSANDFAYEMLCKIEENNDNLLLFEGYSNTPNNISFTNLSSYESSSFLTDLFIQIDDEQPLNLTQLAKGEIALPTEGKYKNIAIINEEALSQLTPMATEPNRPVVTSSESVTTQDSNNGYGLVKDNVDEAIYFRVYPISLLISLDYDSFSDDVKMKNGDKQCVIKIWGNGFIRLLPYRAFLPGFHPVVNNLNMLAIEKANDCILDATVCDSNIDIPLLFNSRSVGPAPSSLKSNVSTYDSSNRLYLPLTIESLLVGFGDATQKLTFASSLKASFMESFFDEVNMSGYFSYLFNNINNESNDYYYLTSLNDFNFYMNLKEIDCSDVNYYNDYINMANFLFSTPLAPLLDVHSMSAKVKSVENVIFPNFKADIEDNDCYRIETGNSDYSSFIYPYCFNLSAFKLLRKDAILDLINKLPSIDFEINEENMDGIEIIYAGNSGSAPSSVSDNKPVVESLLNNDKTIKTQELNSENVTVGDALAEEFLHIDTDLELFNGNKEVVKTYLYNQYGINNNENKCLNIRYDLNKKMSEATSEVDLLLDKKWFHSILVSPSTFKELTEEDIKLAKDKGWRIVTGLNYPINPLSIMQEES